MSSLKSDFNELLERVRLGREFAHASFEPIYYLVFHPNQILDVKRQTPAWVAKLRNEGWDVTVFSIAENVADIFANAPMRKLWLTADSKNPLDWDKTNKSLANALTKSAQLQSRLEVTLSSLTDDAKGYFSALIAGEVDKRRQAYQNFEPFHEFILPARIRDYCCGGTALAFDRHTLIGEEGERLVANAYGFTAQQAETVERDLREAILHQYGVVAESDDEESADDDSDFSLDTSPYAIEEAHISYLLGCAFGRWDIRLATGERQPESLLNPFAPLPVCPPGMLQNDKGLPARDHELPEEYPLAVAWSGVLVDDEDNCADVVEQVQSALRVIWKGSADAVEEETCVKLASKSLRDYFRRSSGFFADHFKRYTKSSRKAPIYWPLSTMSGSYTLWLYYPCLSSQTLYTAINYFVEPKLKQVSADVTALRNKGSARTRDDEKQFEALQAFELELIELRDTLLKLAPTYKPNHDDGVQISAAPLWPLFRHKPWQKVLKATWAKLEKGDYDWAHLAMNYWPERVREKCKSDKSLAIAHGLEDLYIEPPPKPKKTRGRKAKGV